MDITASSFYDLLPEILSRLSDCCFVALDLEFSGIPISPRKSNEKQSLQERYAEIKQCAEKYQILQVGLTIVHEDAEKGQYLLRPYHLYLNPIVDSGLDLQRDFTLQSNAMRFLFKQNFSMSSVFDRGVGYLSSEEVNQAVARAMQKDGLPATRQTLKVGDSEPESIAFLNTVRTLVDQWVGHSNVQKKLVHGLIEMEYPYLTATAMGPFIQICQRDEKREAAQNANRVTEKMQQICKSKGFGWLAEALVGGDLSDLDPSCFQSDMGVGRSLAKVTKAADVVKQDLRTNQFLLVGHNLFVDLVYFCRCFVGPLPDSVADFQVMARSLFPRVVDTKYLATHSCGDLNPPSSLGEVHQKLLPIRAPMIVLHEYYRKYCRAPAEHEAGYDSLLTAEVFLKLSVQLRDTMPRMSSEELHHMFATNLRMEESYGYGRPSRSPQLTDCSEAHAKVDKGELIPRPGALFWERYSNRLRVFGTRERICQQKETTLVRRSYATATTPSPDTTAPVYPVVKPTYTINAGVVLSRPPQITRDLHPFEKAYHFYQRRLNERLALPFTKYFYFKRGTPADEDWKRKIKERHTPARDIGNYNAYSPDAWNDELLVGAAESDPAYQAEMLIRDAEETVNATSQDTSKREEIPRPYPRVTEADEKGDFRSLNRALQRTLYFVVRDKFGHWRFPRSPVEQDETLRLAAERTLTQTAGVNINTWMVGYHPVGHHVKTYRRPTDTGLQGAKTFFMKGRIMGGQADLSGNNQELQDFRWLSKEEIGQHVVDHYYSSVKNMLADR
ncbi:CAF1 family ribonuclease [Aspergillus campestris IBT 28561]|uniref:Large ribosomal subunit protein mL46 n=1 Tax=Aspergillus campestris (strain IBT 28561) TaxID=1392248 RepID=A0A2I1CQR0_ASPC2|nr:CAF1 family ribonuclease [Aspergillus campestris IBT 28561]PKX99958.1 CAF1 family ribonuclease [Aspergillus campestris IBT 28561]